MTDSRQPDHDAPGEGTSSGSASGATGGPSLSKAGDADAGSGGSTPTGYGAPQYGPPETSWQATGASSYPAPGQSGSDGPSTGAGYDPPSYSGDGGYAPPTGDPTYGGTPGYGGGYPPAAGGAYGAPGGFGTPPKKKRTGLIVGLVGGGLALVLLLVVGIVVIVNAAGGGGAKPEETVRAYLQALADGNADQALAQGQKPSDTAFVTTDALDAQRDIAKITDINVTENYSGSTTASVTATYKFGERQANERYSLTKIGDDWKLRSTTYQISVSSLDDVPGLTVLGIEVGDRSQIDVFPGPLTWGSSNKYISVKDTEPDSYSLSPDDYGSLYSSLQTGLTDDGEQAVADAVTTYLSGCAASKSLEPEDCPQAEYDYTAVDGSATWTPPADLSSLEYQTGSPVTDVYVSGDLTWSVTYTADDGTGAKPVTVNDVDGSLYGEVDLTQDPPVYSE